MVEWWQRIKQLNDWSVGYDWDAHLVRLNERIGQETPTRANDEDYRLGLSIPGWPPAWFNGDLANLRADDWVLVVSLNPSAPSEDHYPRNMDPSASWQFWSDHNASPRNWNANSQFFPRLIELASVALSREVVDRNQFAMRHMLFLELCPYASKKFPTLKWETIQSVADGDIGFAINRQIRSIAINHGRPRLILVNGEKAVHDVNDYQRPSWENPVSAREAMPKYREGFVNPWKQSIPILGFDFLGRRNSNTRFEMEFLRQRIGAIVA